MLMPFIRKSEDTTPKGQISARIASDAGNLPEVVHALSGVLASTYVLYQKSLYYHWNVTGRDFYALHKLFEAHYEELNEAGDEIAERIRALGHVAKGTMRDFIEMSFVREDETLPESAEKMIANLADSHEICARQANDACKAADALEDSATADLMTRRMLFHDKASWMLRALLAH
jgi:starvation-inducible DNA-binding protein